MSKFLRVKCGCGNEQNVFGNASSSVSCLVCGNALSKATGSQVEIADGVKVIRVL